jgi:hypothetical protein
MKRGFAVIKIIIVLAVMSASGQQQFNRIINFSGYSWKVKSGYSGPGPNYFSDSLNNVWVDSGGRLHLKITPYQNSWLCSEVVLTQSLGYGAYRFYLDSDVSNLDRNVVLGLFTWSDDPDYYHRETDIEFSKYGNANNFYNAQYVSQPYTQPDRVFAFIWPGGIDQSIQSFFWRNNAINFASVIGFNPKRSPLQQWSINYDIPQAGNENARINLWLFKGNPPARRKTPSIEIVVNHFEFIPL